MKIGAHVSIAGGIDKAPLNAHDEGCECFQIFSRSPRGGKTPELTQELVESFQANMKKCKLENFYIHTPYYINLASKQGKVKHGSINVIREELDRGSVLGARCVVTHLGSAKEYENPDEALDVVVEGLKKSLDGYDGTCGLALEIAAGSGAIIGSNFENLGYILHALHKTFPKLKDRLQICLDTCHSFASGYDMRDKNSVEKTLAAFDEHIGLEHLAFIHLNDSKTDLGSHVDRHDHIETGKIGKKGIELIINHPKLKNLDFILETSDNGRDEDMNIIRSIRK